MTTTAIPGGAPLSGAADPWPPLPRPRVARPTGSIASVPRRGPTGAEGRGRVIVGLRGTEHAEHAIAVGLAEAERRGADLVITLVHDGTDVPASSGASAEGAAPADDDEFVARLIEAAAMQHPTVRVTATPCTGPFVRVMLELAKRAELVVLGDARRFGVGARDLAGLAHAVCPVIVVRETAPSPGV